MDHPQHAPPGRHQAHALGLWILLAILLYAPCIHPEIGQGNVASDLAAIESLVERHTFYINGATFDTIDKFKLGDQFFSQKSPIFHLIAAIPYAALQFLGYTLREHTGLCLRILTLFMVIIPMGCLLWMLWDHPWVRMRPPRWRLAFTTIFALGSALTPFAVTLNHYIPAAACLMMAARRLARLQDRNPLRDGLHIGFWISAGLSCDVPPAFLLGFALTLVWLPQSANPISRARLIGLILGAIPLLLLYAALNQIILGSPLPPNLHETDLLYFEGSFWKEIRDHALAGNPEFYQASYARRLWHSMLGHKGIYWMMPLLIVATVAAVRLARHRAKDWPLALGSALFPPFTIAVAMIWAFDLSGGAYAIRHCLATLPPLYIVLAHPSLPNPRLPSRMLFVLFSIWGTLIAFIGILNPWSHNTLSAYPPLENLARFSLRNPTTLPTDWIEPVIEHTSVKPANGWLDFGLAWSALGDGNRAIHGFTRALDEDPDYALALYHLGIEFAKARRFQDAIRTYQRLAQMEPGNVGAWNNLATFAIQAGDFDLAADALNGSDRAAPRNAGMLFRLLVIEEIQNRAATDSPLLIEALRLHPDDARIRDLAHRWGRAIEAH